MLIGKLKKNCAEGDIVTPAAPLQQISLFEAMRERRPRQLSNRRFLFSADTPIWQAQAAVDACLYRIYKTSMSCAFPRLMTVIESRGVAAGPEGMSVR